MKETAVIIILLMSLITLGVVCIKPIKAQYQGDITINADGSVSPSTAPIQQDDDMYILTGDFVGSISVLRSNITVNGNGHIIQGEAIEPTEQYPIPRNSGGIYLYSVHNVTVKDFSIKSCLVGVSLNQSSHVAVSGNNITGTWGQIYYYSPEHELRFSPQRPAGVFLWQSSSNTIKGNRLENNEIGLCFRENSEKNIITENTISGNTLEGVLVTTSSNNTFYHNNFDNELNVYDNSPENSPNTWDNGAEGNFWSDYSGPDANNDGIGGSWYIIDSNNQDRYPLIKPWEPDTAPPHISIFSPANITYNDSNVALTFFTSKPTSKISYSLDMQDNVTITGNTTLNEVPNGSHSLTVYATDQFGNTGTSETIYFNIDAPEPFPTAPVAAGITSATAVCIGVLIYFKKRKH